MATSTSTAARALEGEASPTTLKTAYEERQGMAMSWLWSTMLLFFLLSALALGAALVFQVGFIGWLISLGIMGGILVATIVAITRFILNVPSK